MDQKIAFFVAAGAGALAFMFWPQGFSSADIDRIQGEIREEFAKRLGVQVVSVDLVRRNRGEAVGFARIRIAEAEEIAVPCQASMDPSSGRYVWHCSK